MALPGKPPKRLEELGIDLLRDPAKRRLRQLPGRFLGSLRGGQRAGDVLRLAGALAEARRGRGLDGARATSA